MKLAEVKALGKRFLNKGKAAAGIECLRLFNFLGIAGIIVIEHSVKKVQRGGRQ